MKSAKVLTNVTNNAQQILTALRTQMVEENPSFGNRLPQVTQDISGNLARRCLIISPRRTLL